MSTVRALLRTSGYNPLPLPTTSRPQVVNDDGFELAPDAVSVAEGDEMEVDGEECDEEEAVEGGDEAEEVDEAVEEEDVVMEEAEEAEVGEEEGNEKLPLLSLADSLVLPYSLTQTRHHHLTTLLPRMFVHPPIPSHSKPRAKLPPKGTFLFPTPPPPVHPLPTKEYHAGSSVESAAATGASPSSTPAPGTAGEPSSSTPAPTVKPKPKARRRLGEVEPPAHEIECISRCTLSLGPITFPNTELWIGQFVEPRAAKVKKERAKPGQRAAREKARKEAAEEAKKRAAAMPKPKPQPKPKTVPVNAAAGASGSGSVGRPPAVPRPPVGPSAVRPPVRPTASAAAGSKSAASPQLIQLVNQAASRHPWLSALIYKAAGSTANQDELERLGKAVARLSRGEPIDDLAPAGAAKGVAGPSTAAGAKKPEAGATAGPGRPPAAGAVGRPPAAGAAGRPPAPGAATGSGGSARPPASAAVRPPATSSVRPPATSTVRPPAPVRPPPPTADTASASAPTPAAVAAPAKKGATGDDSDSEVDMKGPKQVGGGPMPLPTVAPAGATSSVSQRPPAGPAAQPASAAAGPPAGISAGGTSAVSVSGLGSTAAPNPAGPARPSATPAPAPAPAQGGTPVATPTPNAIPNVNPSPTPYPASTLLGPPPPPPGPPPLPPHLIPPPFLLVAFKEHPTDKFLIPLGSRSFISRVGGDYVTGPEPVAPPVPVAPVEVTKAEEKVGGEKGEMVKGDVKMEDATAGPNTPSASTPASTPILDKAGKASRGGRTRASLGRHAKHPTPPPPPSAPTLPPAEPTPPPPEAAQPTGPAIPAKALKLPQVPGMQPPLGTVLVSMFVPAGSWGKVEWEKVGRRVPWSEEWEKEGRRIKAEAGACLGEGEVGVKTEVVDTDAEAGAGANQDETTAPLKASEPKHKPTHPPVLNLAAEDFLPADGPLRAVTIRLGEVDDQVWQRMKGVMEIVERREIAALVHAGALSAPNEWDEAYPIAPLSSAAPSDSSAVLRAEYTTYKTNVFTSLLSRATPSRTFLRTRLTSPPADVIEATTDKLAPRAYPISTKPLYHVDEGDMEDEAAQAAQAIRLSPDPRDIGDGKGGGRGRKRKVEEVVQFEMPVSLDALDERVEAGARGGLSKRGKGRGVGGIGDGGRVKQRRGVEKGVCEGCAKEGIKVWRRGPTGKGTLCNACGDLFTEGKLKMDDLQAPGAMAALLGTGGAGEDEGKGKEKGKSKEDDGTPFHADAEGNTPTVTTKPGEGHELASTAESPDKPNLANPTVAPPASTNTATGDLDDHGPPSASRERLLAAEGSRAGRDASAGADAGAGAGASDASGGDVGKDDAGRSANTSGSTPKM